MRIKWFFGTSKNAVKTQIRIAISVYVLVAIIKNGLKKRDIELQYSTGVELTLILKNTIRTITLEKTLHDTY